MLQYIILHICKKLKSFWEKIAVKENIIGANDAGQRLDKFLSKAYGSMPKSLMYKYIRLKRIKINGKRADIAYKLCEGDRVTLYINDELLEPKAQRFEFTSAPANIDIVYEDDNILLVNKPEGLSVHPDNDEYRDTLIFRIQHYLYKKGEYNPNSEMSFKPALANRIDRNTCGIVIAAKTANALRILNQKIKSRELDKRYLCVVHGKMPSNSELLEGYLVKDGDKNLVTVTRKPREGSKPIKTKYSVLAFKDNLSLLEVQLITGRTHQIRAHLAAIGHPLLGDGKYGVNKTDRKRGFVHQALCSYKLTFQFESDAGELNYLNGREFCINSVWFAKELFNYT